MARTASVSRFRRTWPLALVLPFALAACAGGDAPADSAATAVDPASPSVVEEWSLPTLQPGSASPNLAAGPDGRILLSWTNSQQGRRHIYQFASWSPDLGRWMQSPATIAIGHSMFVNWADIPHMAATPDGALWAHWLQKNGDAPYAYDVVLSRSRDGGANWAEPVRPHDDRTQTEHGFVSMWAQGRDALGMAWLDGRNTAPDSGHEGHEAAMTLRAAVFDSALQAITDTFEVDGMVCDCCQTSVTSTSKGALLVYRGRTPDEIRDIMYSRFDGQGWSAPARVHADDWTMPACPVNGPSVASAGDAVVVGWYTVDGDTPLVRLAASPDAGDGFGAAVELDRGPAVQGRVNVAMDAAQAWALWLREDAQGQTLWLSRRSHDLATEYERLEVAKVNGSGRATGFPQLIVKNGVAYIVWTDVAGGAPTLKGVRVVRG